MLRDGDGEREAAVNGNVIAAAVPRLFGDLGVGGRRKDPRTRTVMLRRLVQRRTEGYTRNTVSYMNEE